MFYGLVCIAIGCYPIVMSLGFVAIAEPDSTTPPWVIFGAGFSFVIAGLMILLAHHSRGNDLLAGVLLLVFAAMGVWVSIFSPDSGFSGGLPFLPREQNVLLGRWLFGLGACISLSLSIWAFRRAASER